MPCTHLAVRNFTVYSAKYLLIAIVNVSLIFFSFSKIHPGFPWGKPIFPPLSLVFLVFRAGRGSGVDIKFTYPICLGQPGHGFCDEQISSCGITLGSFSVYSPNIIDVTLIMELTG